MKNTNELKSKLNVTSVTLQELADTVGTNRMALYRWDNGGKIPPNVSSFVKGMNYMNAAPKQGKSYSHIQMQTLANEIKRLKGMIQDNNLSQQFEGWLKENDIKGTFISMDKLNEFFDTI